MKIVHNLTVVYVEYVKLSNWRLVLELKSWWWTLQTFAATMEF